MSHDNPTPGPRGLDTAVVLAGVLTLGAGVAFFSFLTTGEQSTYEAEHPLAFAPIEVDTAKLKRQRTQKYGEARQAFDPERFNAFYTLVRRLNRSQFRPDSRDEGRRLARELSYKAEDVVAATGFDAFVAAGKPMFTTCTEGLESLLGAVRDGQMSLKEARRDPPQSTFARYRENCGQFLPTLLERGLVDETGKWAEPAPRSRTVADLLQRMRWASQIRDVRPPLLQLTEYGREILMRWRIETDAYSAEKRLSYLDRLASDPNLVPHYDAALARAKVAYATEGPQRAASVLKAALEDANADREDYQRRLEWLKRRDSKHSSPSADDSDEPT